VSQAIKEAVMALFAPTEEPVELDLPVAPDASIEIIICPHCEQRNCEVWDSTEARLATCTDCGAEFCPPVMESESRAAIIAITERRIGLRSRVVNSEITRSDAVKGELVRLLSR
jgi:hypothetical protein